MEVGSMLKIQPSFGGPSAYRSYLRGAAHGSFRFEKDEEVSDSGGARAGYLVGRKRAPETGNTRNCSYVNHACHRI